MVRPLVSQETPNAINAKVSAQKMKLELELLSCINKMYIKIAARHPTITYAQTLYILLRIIFRCFGVSPSFVKRK